VSGAARLRLGPWAAQGFVVLFCLSTAFPIAASLLPPSGVSTALGALDLVAAAAVLVLGFIIESTARDQVTDEDRRVAWRVVRILANVPLLLLIAFFVRADIVRWDVLLVGLAWRTWLLLWVVQSVVALFRSRRST
jgi:Na+/H+ antiporter NhaD/arsenite permease-like protein